MWTLLIAACSSWTATDAIERTVPVVDPGPPVAGVAEGSIDFPMGAALGGYTGRCNCFGNSGEVDKRDSAYTLSFNPSAGIQTRPRAQAFWLENGDQDMVVIKVDLIYTSDHLVQDLETRLTDATGINMDGKVVVAASHTHNAPANWHPGITWWLGGDRFHHESFERLSTSVANVALDAWESRVPAAIGIGVAHDWDPDDKVYSDRREENDDLGFFDDIPDGKYKDPTLTLLRIDTADGEPMGVFFSFATHGTSLGADNQMWSSDSIGGLEIVVQEAFDSPVVVAQMQAGGGDASPRGTDREYARLETIGEYAVDAITDLWAATPTSTDSIRLETVSHAIDTSRDEIRVTRDGTVDWYYSPYDDDEDFQPDEIIFDENGDLVSPIDEFNTENGGAFCGADVPKIPGVSVGSTTYPYNSCIEVGTISGIIAAFFELSQSDLVLPLNESLRAGTTASRFGPVPMLQPDGTETSEEVLMAFFPGEPTSIFIEQFRRRATAEVGIGHAWPVGFSQDHEGYLLVPEDWLLGGYEPNINVWGPLQAEYIMEGVLEMSQKWLLTDEIEPHDPDDSYLPTDYIDLGIDPEEPDLTPDAGTALTAMPEYLYTPLTSFTMQVAPDAGIARVQGVAQLAWQGGDPGVDLPRVVLEMQQDDGSWVEVTTHAGRPITEALPDILITHTPDPLYPASADQTHTWWAAWQAVGHVHDRAGVPEGTYRLKATGYSYDGGGTEYPWPVTAYEIASDPFTVVPSAVTVGWDGATLSAYIAGPAWGWRLVDIDGSSIGANPLVDPVLTWEYDDGSIESEEPGVTVSGGISYLDVTPPADAITVEVSDIHGNTGRIEL